MKRISTDELLAFVKTLGNREVQTLARGAKFLVRVSDGGLDLTICSTKKHRHQSGDYIERVIEHYYRTGSLRPKDYKFTAHASYTLALLALCVDASDKTRTKHVGPK